MTDQTIASAARVRLTQTEYATLAALGHLGPDEVSGYDMKKFVDGALGYVWAPSKTHLYAVLRRLVDEGLATRRNVAQSTRPNKQLYRITELGRAVVRSWLDRPETESDPDRSIFMLKLFFGSQAGREPLLFQLVAFHGLYTERLATYEQKRAGIVEAGSRDPFTYLALLYGIARARAAVDWADEALHELGA
jgi:DNA-binding PadR family transcriptional regulator